MVDFHPVVVLVMKLGWGWGWGGWGGPSPVRSHIHTDPPAITRHDAILSGL